MSDEGFHEIQLNGKQLVFLFMAAAVVLVVVFLSGVMVGRGVRTDRAAVAPGESAALPADLAAAAPGGTAPPAGQVPAQPAGGLTPGAAGMQAVAPPPPVADEMSRLPPPEGAGAPALKPPPTGGPVPADGAAVPPRSGAGPRAAPTDTSRKAGATAKPVSGAPASTAAGFAVQVAAPRDRAAAEVIVRRLAGRGYPAYILDPASGSAQPVYYRVRVGPYKTRSEADEAKRRLEKEEQFKPFITR